MAKRKENGDNGDNGSTFTAPSGPASPEVASFNEALASAPPPPTEAVAAAAAVIADITAGSASALKHADVIAAYYAGKRAGAIDLCNYLETNWGVECGAAAADWRKKIEKAAS